MYIHTHTPDTVLDVGATVVSEIRSVFIWGLNSKGKDSDKQANILLNNFINEKSAKKSDMIKYFISICILYEFYILYTYIYMLSIYVELYVEYISPYLLRNWGVKDKNDYST